LPWGYDCVALAAQAGADLPNPLVLVNESATMAKDSRWTWEHTVTARDSTGVRVMNVARTRLRVERL